MQPQVFQLPLPIVQAQQVDSQRTPPHRVLVALRFLSDLSEKTANLIAFTEIHGLETAEGQKLTPCEEEAQMAAHELLRDYFQGKLQPDWREKLEDKKTEKEIVTRSNGGHTIHCPACNPQNPREDCLLCCGTGWCLLVPSNKTV